MWWCCAGYVVGLPIINSTPNSCWGWVGAAKISWEWCSQHSPYSAALSLYVQKLIFCIHGNNQFHLFGYFQRVYDNCGYIAGLGIFLSLHFYNDFMGSLCFSNDMQQGGFRSLRRIKTRLNWLPEISHCALGTPTLRKTQSNLDFSKSPLPPQKILECIFFSISRF